MKKVFVGISGGVDSVVTALILKNLGYDVEGVFIKGWDPEFVECTMYKDLQYAMRNCAKLSIPFRVLDLSKEYKELVIDPFISGYKNGITPNPDIFCNRSIKFGLFLKWAIKNGADKIATGHYTKLIFSDRYHLMSSKDTTKDQTYFLWMLTQEELKYVLFPLGDIYKSEVRKIANANKLPSADRKDSAGICFLGEIDIKNFLSRFINFECGDVMLDNKRIGAHDGLPLYVKGQKYRNENLNKSYLVVDKDYKQNVLIVADGDIGQFLSNTVNIRDKNYINKISHSKPYLARIRHGGEKLQVNILENKVNFKVPQLFSSGQSIVFYSLEGECLGGAVMSD